MKATTVVAWVAGGLFATPLFAQSPAAPGQGWTRDEARRVPHRPTELGYIAATVLKISVTDRGRFIVTLDNGQKWAQTENKPDLQLSIGDDIKISKSSIGSYRLTTPDGIETNVRRDR